MPPISSELLTVWLTAAAHLVVLGCAIFGVVAALKHSAHALHWSCLDGPAGQVALRVGPILAGAAFGPVTFEGFPITVAVLLGSIAGAQSRGLYRLARRVGGERIGALLMTSEHRERRPQDPGGEPPWEGPWAAAVIVLPGMSLDDAVTVGVGLLIGAALVGAWSLRTIFGRPPARNDADAAYDRAAEDLAHRAEVKSKEASRAEGEAASARVDAIDAISDPRPKHKAILDEYQRRHPGSR